MYETLAFVDALVNDKPSPCSGEDGLVALIMSIAAGKSAEENRWVKFSEIANSVECGPEGCQVVDLFPDEVEAAQKASGGWLKKTGSWISRRRSKARA